MITFKRVDGDLRDRAQAYLGQSFPPEYNVYAAYEDGLVGAGALTLRGTTVEIAAFMAEAEHAEFALRSLVYVASNPGLAVEGSLPELVKYGFKPCDGAYRALARDVVFPSQCGH